MIPRLLTNAYNRRYYNARVTESKNICAFAIVNVDHSKEANDTYRRTISDKVPIDLAKTISENSRTQDTLS